MMFNLIETVGEFLGCILQGIGIDAHTVHLHVGENRHQRHFYIPEQIFTIYLFEFRFEHIFQSQCDVGVLGCIFVNI